MQYKLGSLFDGSGGFPLSGALCGVEPVWAAEVEPYPIAVTRSRFPKMKHLGDISKIHGGEIEPVDIITFGSPCQDLSVAGKRAGLKHEANGDEETTRSGLFMEAVRIIKEMRSATNGKYPTFALWENVPGAFSSNKGEDFRIVCEELIKIVEPSASMPSVPQNGWNYADSYIGDGWSLAYRVFDAQYWGVPQRRRRIYLVADFRGERAREILFEREGVRGYFAQGTAPWQTTPADAQGGTGADDREGEMGARAVDGGSDGCGRGGRQLDAIGCGLYNCAETGDQAATLTTQGGGTASGPSVLVPYTLKIRGGVDVDSSGKAAGKGTLIQKDLSATLGTSQDQYLFQPTPIHDQATRFSGKRGDKADGKGNGLGVGEPGDPMNTLTSGDRHAVVYAVDQGAGKSGANVSEGTAPTLCTTHGGEPVIAFDRAAFNQGQNAKAVVYSRQRSDELVENSVVSTQSARQYKDATDLVVENSVRYIVRRLTPTECARLQGFADWWGIVEQKNSLTDEEYQFWLEVRNTHARINGKKEQDYTEKQMLTWYNKLWTDSSEYKMWGNGIALPTALYCVQGVVEALNKPEDDLDDWMM